MLVSYDILDLNNPQCCILQGHQNVGELRLFCSSKLFKSFKLQGHQNVGELRLSSSARNEILFIAGSPECWCVTTILRK